MTIPFNWFLSQELLPMLAMFSIGLGIGKADFYGFALGVFALCTCYVVSKFHLIENPYLLKTDIKEAKEWIEKHG